MSKPRSRELRIDDKSPEGFHRLHEKALLVSHTLIKSKYNITVITTRLGCQTYIQRYKNGSHALLINEVDAMTVTKVLILYSPDVP